MTKHLFVNKRTRTDILETVSYLTTRVSEADEDDWKKLNRLLQYLRITIKLMTTLSADSISSVKWWVVVSYVVHNDM